jgi:hypothetical protein
MLGVFCTIRPHGGDTRDRQLTASSAIAIGARKCVYYSVQPSPIEDLQ